MAGTLIEFVPVNRLRHIEDFSPKRVAWLREKIMSEGVWTKPLALDLDHDLVMDGQHRMEVAKSLGLAVVPVVRFSYGEVSVWSLRPKTQEVNRRLVVERSLSDEIYPFKTVKHAFPTELPSCSYSLERLGLGKSK